MNLNRKVTDDTACVPCQGWGHYGVSYSEFRAPIYHECTACGGTGKAKPPPVKKAASVNVEPKVKRKEPGAG